MVKETTEGTEIIAFAPVYQDGTIVRGKIPTPVVRALKAKDGDVLAFERLDGAIVLRKSTAAERKGQASQKGGKR